MNPRRHILRLITAALLFLLFYYPGQGLLGLGLWFIVGDADQMFRPLPYVAASLGLLAALLFLFGAYRHDSTRFTWITFSLVSVLLLAFGAYYVADQAKDIRGTDSRAAAMSSLARQTNWPDVASLHLVEHRREDLHMLGRGPTIIYRVYRGDQPISYIIVSRLWWHWWIYGGHIPEDHHPSWIDSSRRQHTPNCCTSTRCPQLVGVWRWEGES